MIRINKRLALDPIKDEFASNRIVAIDDFLQTANAEQLHAFLYDSKPSSWWTVSVRYNEVIKYFRCSNQNQALIEKAYKKAIAAFKNGRFSYFFRRTVGDHRSICSCLECRFKAFLISDSMIQFLDKVGVSVSSPGEIFSSCYIPGDFLSPHHDQCKGRLGFVLSLSKDWKPEYGGNLHFLEDDWVTVKRVFVPTFNRLILFDLSARKRVPHFVSSVFAGKRISVSGWMQ